MKISTVLALLVPLLVVACSHPDDDVIQVESPKTDSVAFEGKVVPAFTATWQTPDGRSTMALRPDGGATLASNISTPGGPQKTEIKGRWKAVDDTILFEDDAGKVTRYYATPKGKDTIEIRREKGSHIVIVYKRKA